MMKVPIRMLGIATSVFWVLLIVFIVLAAYSVTDLRFDLNDPQLTIDPDGQLIFNLPLIIDNGGYYSLREFHIATLFSNEEGQELSRAHTLVPVIPSGEIITINHNVTLNMEDIYRNHDNYLFEDNDLQVSLLVGLNFAEVLPSQISTNFTFPCGAPFSNFDLDQPDISRFNLTHSIISVPMSFENHALYDVLGSIDVELYDEANSLVSETQELISTPQQTSYDENIELFVPINGNSLNSIQNGYFNIYFSTLIFEHGPMVIPYG
jgi:hypothetical protein